MESGLCTEDIAGVLGLPVPVIPASSKRGAAESDDEDDFGFLDFDGSFEGGNLGVAQARHDLLWSIICTKRYLCNYWLFAKHILPYE